MHSDEQIRDLLFDYVDDVLDLETRRLVSERLETNAELQSDYALILEMKNRARVWHDIEAPNWNPPRIVSEPRWSLGGLNVHQWFPTVASTAALLLVIAVYVREPQTPATVIPTAAIPAAQQYLQPASYDDPTQNAFAQSLLETGRQQRQEELTAMMKILTAEMNKRELETEESLRFIISHQIREQQDLDALYEQVQKLDDPEPDATNDPGETL